ncbi:calcium-binding protein, partial [Pseudomonas capsici]|uniref:calcium-binding protein n=1 Tax=Pseudomonas capsici TaxID=2810614 RepID=UPI00298D83DF
DIIHAGAGNDTVDGGYGTNQLFGEAGDDVLKVALYSTNNNVLVGGTGNDQLVGSYYSDTYVFNLGDGRDTIIESDAGFGGVDVLRFGAGIKAEDISIQRTGADLALIHRNGTDQVIIPDWLSGASENRSRLLERIEFADGQVWTWSDLTSRGVLVQGSEGDDLINGWVGNDLIEAGAGNDVIDGGDGNDIIHGGAGNDTIDGGYGVNQLFGEAGDDVLKANVYA